MLPPSLSHSSSLPPMPSLSLRNDPPLSLSLTHQSDPITVFTLAARSRNLRLRSLRGQQALYYFKDNH